MGDLFKNFTTNYPTAVHTVGLIVLGIISGYGIHFWNKYAHPFVDHLLENAYSKEKILEQKVNGLIDNNIYQDHWSLEQIIDKCHRKGYRNSLDRRIFMEILHLYKNIGGNTDAEALLQDFMAIPYSTELKVPEKAGIENPSQSALDELITFYNRVKNKIIAEQDIKSPKIKIVYEQEEENKE